MASKACNAKFLLDGYDMSGQSSGASIALDATSIDYDQMDTCVALKIPTAPATVFDHNGYYTDKTAGYLEKETYDRLGATADNYIGYIPDSSLTVAPAYVIDNTFASVLKMEAPVKGLLTVTGQWPTGDNATARGYVVYTGTISATGVKTYVDFGAAGAAGGRAFLFVRAITGTATNATVVVESCATSGGTYDVEGTFTFSTAVPNAYAIDLSGTVNRYIHINTTSKGGATSFDVTVIVAVTGVTQ
jgi:hypothetical protein